MIKLFYALPEHLTQKYTNTKDDLISAKKDMSPAEIETAKSEIRKECKIYDFNPDKPESLYSVNNGIAEIPIAGMLVDKPDICAVFFGETVTTYKFIQEATIKAESDPMVEKIVYNVNSGGGYVSECEETFQVMLGCKKKTIAAVHDMAASAAYWLSSACDEIISVSKTGFFGSIGVAVEVINRDKQDEDHGIKRTILTNNSSKNKRPDLATKKGQQVLIDELDAIYKVFKTSILAKRHKNMSAEDIDNLEGKVLISEDAIKYGLSDKYMNQSELIGYLKSSTGDINISAVADNNTTPEGDTEEAMNFEEFLAANPDAKKAYEGALNAKYAEGVEAGKEEVRATIKKITPIMESDKYDSALKAQATKALNGEMPLDSFMSVVAIDDMRMEREKSANAKGETEELGDTPAEQTAATSEDGTVETEADYQAAIAKGKADLGIGGAE